MTPDRARRQQQIFRVVNVPMRGLLSLPFATPISRRLMLCTRRVARVARSIASLSATWKNGDTLLTPSRLGGLFVAAGSSPWVWMFRARSSRLVCRSRRDVRG
jgi:hypothetical protein